MATLKNPSIYDDRSTIGSADELDEYGVWVKIEPEELPDTGADAFPDFDADFGPDLSLDETAEDDGLLGEFDYSGDGENIGFDDVEALRQDIQAEPPAPPAANPAIVPPADPDTPDLSTRLLMKIADELSSIKDELALLKEELSVIRSEKPPKNAPGDNVEEGGFFDEEDDGKIALTGDELDNIIHTADFTEETGDDAGASQADNFALQDAPPAPEAGSRSPDPVAETELIYDGLGRPLTRKIARDETPGLSSELQETDDLQALRESGVESMTALPEIDTSYLEEDPLAEENLDLSDAVIDEPDLSEGIQDMPLEESSLDNLPLIDLDNVETPEDAPLESLDKGEFVDLSLFDDAIPAESPGGSADTDTVEPGFELLDEDAAFPVRENVQDNVITDDSFESVSFDDDEIDEVSFDDSLEQTLPDGMKIELEDIPPPDLSTPEFDGDVEETELDDINFEFPGAADNADAGDPASPAEAPPSIMMELKDVLVYMDKLLESLPEEKIDEFAQSEHYTAYKKLFDELGIQQ
jgi:hypothetical protein